MLKESYYLFSDEDCRLEVSWFGNWKFAHLWYKGEAIGGFVICLLNVMRWMFSDD